MPEHPHPRADLVAAQFTPWPMVPGASRRPIGAGLVSVLVAQGPILRHVHAWFDPANGLTAPVRRGNADPQILIQSDGDQARVTITQIRFDQDDDLLADVWLPRDLPLPSPVGLPFLDATALGIVDALASALTADHPALGDEVVAVSSDVAQLLPPDAEHPCPDLSVHSWHIALDGRTTRAVEASALFDPDIEHVRARVLKVHRSGAREPDLLVCPLDGPARHWPPGTHPHLDAPRTGKDLPPDVAAIAAAVAPHAPRA